MPVINVVTENDIDQTSGLLVEDGKLKASVDGTSIKFNQQGQLMAEATVDVKLAGVQLLPDNVLEFTLSDDTVVTASLADLITTDKHVVSGNFTTENLVLNMSDNTQVNIALAPVMGYLNGVISQTALNKVNEARGEELQDLAGNKLGYLMKEEPASP